MLFEEQKVTEDVGSDSEEAENSGEKVENSEDDDRGTKKRDNENTDVWSKLLINIRSLSIELDRRDVELNFIGEIAGLERFTLGSENRIDERDPVVELAVDKLPSNLKFLRLKRRRRFGFEFIEDVLNLDKFANLKYLYIEWYLISKDYLLQINRKLDLIGFGFQCLTIDWDAIEQISNKQQNLKRLSLKFCIFNGFSTEFEVNPFVSVKKLDTFIVFFRSTIQEFQYFLSLFPNVRTMDLMVTGVVCEQMNIIFPKDICESCLKLSFDPFFKQMISIRKLIIEENVLKVLISYLFADNIGLSFLHIYHTYVFLTDDVIEDIEWQIEQAIMAFIKLSERSPNRAFEIRYFEERNVSIDLVIPKNLNVLKLQ